MLFPVSSFSLPGFYGWDVSSQPWLQCHPCLLLWSLSWCPWTRPLKPEPQINSSFYELPQSWCLITTTEEELRCYCCFKGTIVEHCSGMHTVLWVDPTFKPIWKRRWFSCTKENDIQWTWAQCGKQISNAIFHIRKIRMKTDFPMKRQLCLTPAPPSFLRGTCAIAWMASTSLLSSLLFLPFSFPSSVSL